MKIIVTGSSGTIGTRVCETLLASGHEVIGVDIRPNVFQPSVQAITTLADLREPDAMRSVDPKGVDAILHLAANARVYDLVLDPLQALDNVTMLFHTLEWARGNGVKGFVFASSRECYGNIRVERYTEDAARIENSESPYSASKISGEAYVHAYRRCYGMKTAILRFSNVYGAYDFSDRVVPLFLRRAKAGEVLKVFGEKKCLDFTYIDDTVAGIIKTLEKLDTISGETLNLAFGEGTTIKKLAETVRALVQSKSEIRFEPDRVGEVTHYIADISRAKKLLGYAPTVSFDAGIRKATEWYAAHPEQ